MIFGKPPDDEPLDQGDILDGCPVLEAGSFIPSRPDAVEVVTFFQRVIVLTQTCDLANVRTPRINVAVPHEAGSIVTGGLLKPGDVRGPLRAGRVFGWYFLPASDEIGLPETLVDLRDLHSVPRPVVDSLVAAGKRRGRLRPLYRQHLGKHFGDTFSRIGLPEPYPTQD
ncbi:MAG: hypothetical protein ACRC33_19015 [Gemmataceae bacterium]